MVFQKLQHDHWRVYYSFTTMGPYHTFSFNKFFFFHLTTFHETSPIRTSVYLHYTLKPHKATITVLTDKQKVHLFRVFTSVFYKCSPDPQLKWDTSLFSLMTPCPFLSHHPKKMIFVNVYLLNISLPDIRSCNLHESQGCVCFVH